jgi:succinoglycan biosynthesis protein ExoW
MTVVALIIPYYQTKPGILRRALASVLQQDLPAQVRVDIAVVDDGSPVPARAEIEGLDISPPFQLRITEQPNSGVAAARNTALRLVASDTTYIAFLDSDDMWKPRHLATAIDALNYGYDFYFCDAQRIGNAHTAFTLLFFRDFIAEHGKDFGEGFHDLGKGPFVDDCIQLWCAFATPAVVYRRAVAPDLMFDTSLRVAGEDSLFFFQLLDKCRRVCCSQIVLVTLADGVNIYHGKSSWDDPGHLTKHMGTLLANYKFREKLPLSTDNYRVISYRIKRFRGLFAYLTVRYFVKKRERWPQELRQMVRHDPDFLWWYPAWVLYVAIAYLLRLYTPFTENVPTWLKTRPMPKRGR